MTIKIVQEKIKVFVGCDPNNCDLEQMMVLEYSIRKHTKAPVEMVWMQLSRDPDSFWYSNPDTGEGWHTELWATPFSGFRWAIPEYCGFAGRAIYMDTDVIVLCDLAEMWHHPMDDDAIVIAKAENDLTSNETIARLCTCVWDCAKAKSYLPSLQEQRQNPKAHQQMMATIKSKPELVTPYQDSYNCVDGEGLAVDAIKVLHYSDMGTQFSHRYSIDRLKEEGSKHWFDGAISPHPRHDLTHLFDRYYEEAIEAGYQLDDYRTQPFGVIPKKSHKHYKGNKVVRRSLKEALLKKILKR